MSYVIVYYKNGERAADRAATLELAIADYQDKKALTEAFDDRFVSHVEDARGQKVYP